MDKLKQKQTDVSLFQQTQEQKKESLSSGPLQQQQQQGDLTETREIPFDMEATAEMTEAAQEKLNEATAEKAAESVAEPEFLPIKKSFWGWVQKIKDKFRFWGKKKEFPNNNLADYHGMRCVERVLADRSEAKKEFDKICKDKENSVEEGDYYAEKEEFVQAFMKRFQTDSAGNPVGEDAENDHEFNTGMVKAFASDSMNARRPYLSAMVKDVMNLPVGLGMANLEWIQDHAAKYNEIRGKLKAVGFMLRDRDNKPFVDGLDPEVKDLLYQKAMVGDLLGVILDIKAGQKGVDLSAAAKILTDTKNVGVNDEVLQQYTELFKKEKQKMEAMAKQVTEDKLKESLKAKAKNYVPKNFFGTAPFTEDSLQKAIADYPEMTDQELVEQAEEARKKLTDEDIKNLYGQYRGGEKDEENGYILSSNGFKVNQYAADKQAYIHSRRRDIDMDVEDKIRKQELVTRQDIEAFRIKALLDLDAEIEKLEKTTKSLDKALTTGTIKGKKRMSRLVSEQFLTYGLGIKLQNEDYMDTSQEDRVTQINKRHGVSIQNDRYTSVGNRPDVQFMNTGDNTQIMLTMLFEDGHKCFVTENFYEGELIFQKGLKYTVVGAIGYEKKGKNMKLTGADFENNGKDVKFEDNEGEINGIEIVVKVSKEE